MQNGVEHTGDVVCDIVVGDAIDAISFPLELSGARGIRIDFVVEPVRPAIDLDDQPALAAGKIREVRPIAAWRTNLKPPSCRLRSSRHSFSSAATSCDRRARDRFVRHG